MNFLWFHATDEAGCATQFLQRFYIISLLTTGIYTVHVQMSFMYMDYGGNCYTPLYQFAGLAEKTLPY